MDPVVLSRIQFAWVIAWHFLLPAFTIGLAAFIAVLEGLNLFTGREIYLRISTFWIKIFAVSFGMGVVSGIVMPFQIGTNWSRYSDATANVVGPLLAYEGLTAFFLEAAFLGVLLFGRKLVPPWAHFVAALMVALGTLFSTFWIIATNSWMQTPAGYEIVDGRFMPKDWLQIIFSPSFPYRLAHIVDAVYITTGFVVVGVAASYLRQGRFVAEARTMLSMTLWLLTVLVPLQFLIGDAHGLNTLEHQPAKLAAIEAIWNTHSAFELNLFAIPDEKAETDRYVIAIPELGSLILTHDSPWSRAWPQGLPRRPAPLADHCPLLRLPDHGGNCGHHARNGGDEPMAALAGRALPRQLVPLVLHAGLSPRLHSGDGRLGDDRGRPSALDGLRAPAHARLRVSLAHGIGRQHFADRLLSLCTSSCFQPASR